MNVAVIGSGLSGLTTAILLQSRGFSVSLFEKRSICGGVLSPIEIGNHSISMGGYMMHLLFIIRDVFSQCHLPFEKYISMQKLDEDQYTVHGPKKRIVVCGNRQKMHERTRDLFGEMEAEAFDKYVQGEANHFPCIFSMINRPYNDAWDLIRSILPFLRSVADLRLGMSVETAVRRYGIKDPDHLLRFTFLPMFLGLKPTEMPALSSIFSIDEIVNGLAWVKGGPYGIVQGMVKAFEELGGRLILKREVSSIVTEKIGRTNKSVVTRIRLNDGSDFEADYYVAAMQIPNLLDNLLDIRLKKWSKKMRLSCSALVILFSVDTKKIVQQLPGFSYFISENPSSFVDMLDHRGVEFLDISFFMVNLSKMEEDTKDTACLVIHIPVPNLHVPLDFTSKSDLFLSSCFQRIEKEYHVALSNHVVSQKFFDPYFFESVFNYPEGAIWGPMPIYEQIFRKRPNSRIPEVGNLFIASSSCHPGPSLAFACLSGELAAKQICLKSKVKF